MTKTTRFNKHEYLIYGIIILLLLAAPVISLKVHSISDPHMKFSFSNILDSWKLIGVFFVVILLHDLLLAPLLIFKHKTWQYLLGLLCLVAVFQTYQCSHRPEDMPPREQDAMEMRPEPKGDRAFRPFGEGRPPRGPRPPVDRHDLMSFIILICAIGTNLGIKLYFRDIEARRRMQALEKENLEQKLEYLKYQLRPHFFMNTLNNIHALVDIEPEKAKECIIDLSKLLRYVLYESNKPLVPASKEMDFMENYVKLMLIRFDDNVNFTAASPDEGNSVYIPPLIFIVFVENAFKHGVGAKGKSSIHVTTKRYVSDRGEERLAWECINTINVKPNERAKVDNEEHGVGLQNVKHRLDLLFAGNYTLDITRNDNSFAVTLDFPITSPEEAQRILNQQP